MSDARNALFVRLLRPHARSVVVCIGLMAAESLVSLAVPWYLGGLAGRALHGQLGASLELVVALSAFLMAQACLRFAASNMAGRLSSRILLGLKLELFSRLIYLPWSVLQRYRHGELVALLTHEVAQLSGFLGTTLLRFLPLALMLAGAVAFMVRVDSMLTIFAIAVVPVIYGVTRAVGRRLRPLGRELQRADADAVAIADECLRQSQLVKSFGQEAFEVGRLRSKLGAVQLLSDQEHQLSSALEPTVQLLAAMSLMAALATLGSTGAAMGRDGADIIRFLLYGVMIARPISALAGFFGQTQLALGHLEHVARVMEQPIETEELGHQNWQPSNGAIEFRDIWFSYPQCDSLLKGVSLSVAGGQTIAICGPNGAGKSTLSYLLTRLLKPCQGSIAIDGVDVAEIDPHVLRKHVVVVSQRIQLMSGTVRDNIVYGLPSVSQALIEAMAAIAQAHEFIRQLPEGYETKIGDDGFRLSGGQRQKLALARALVRRPKILLLDEATSMYDEQSEAEFVAQARVALSDCTLLIITHRRATLALADEVVHIVNGQAA